MRPWSLILVIVCASCGVRVPQPPGVRISVKSTVRIPAQVHVEGHAHVQGNVQTQGQVQVQAPAVEVRAAPYVPPPPPPPAVAIENAPVPEFFGIPLDAAGDIVFVLDCSGSMDELATGRVAQIDATVSTAPDPSAAADPNAAPADPNAGAPTQPPPDPNQPSPDPNQTSQADPNQPADPNAQPAAPQPRRPRKIEVARAELADALARLPAGTRMNVLFFNNELEAFAPYLVPLEESARAGLITFVTEIEPDGRTALAPAMRTALLMNARRVVLLSDGLGNIGGNAEAVLRDAREAMRGGVRIDTIGLGNDQDAWLLSSLAKESGGLYQPL